MSLKRTKSPSPEASCSTHKRSRVDDNDQAKDHSCLIVNLSDDVLLYIMKYLGSLDLFNLGLCCQRFGRVTQDWTLWENVDLMERPLQAKDLMEHAHMFQSITKRIAITAGDHKTNVELSKVIDLITKNCPTLKELVIENYVLDVLKVHIQDFPSTLEKLSMKGTTVDKAFPPMTPFFTKLDQYMPNLTCLILSNCNWVQSQSLLPLSKLPKLKELRLDSCRQFCECVAYASLAARFGFKSLEILDVRKTALGDSDISSFSFTKSLTHLYLENYVAEDEDEEDSDEEQSYQELLYGGERVFDDENLVEIIPQGTIDYTYRPGTITDRSIRMLSKERDENAVNNREGPTSSNPNLKVLVIRNYTRVTNSSLIHLLLNAPPSLEYLDVTGTAVTKDCVNLFRVHRKNVKLVTSFDCNE